MISRFLCTDSEASYQMKGECKQTERKALVTDWWAHDHSSFNGIMKNHSFSIWKDERTVSRIKLFNFFSLILVSFFVDFSFFWRGGAGTDTLIVELTWWILWSFVYNFIVKALSLFSIHRSRKTHPGPVISLTDCPIDPNKVSIYTSINRLQPENWISKIYWNWLLYRKAVGQFRESYIWENQFINQMGCPKSVKVD